MQKKSIANHLLKSYTNEESVVTVQHVAFDGGSSRNMMDVSACNLFTDNVFRHRFNFVLLTAPSENIMKSVIDGRRDNGDLCVVEINERTVIVRKAPL